MDHLPNLFIFKRAIDKELDKMHWEYKQASLEESIIYYIVSEIKVLLEWNRFFTQKYYFISGRSEVNWETFSVRFREVYFCHSLIIDTVTRQIALSTCNYKSTYNL